jgi:hypothetical protein
MSLGALKKFAKELGLDLDACRTLGEARTRLLRSALEFKNIST